MKTTQELLFNGVKATISETDSGEFEITGDEFINQLLAMGFRLGRNDSPERIAEILTHVPEKYRQDFLDGVNGK